VKILAMHDNESNPASDHVPADSDGGIVRVSPYITFVHRVTRIVNSELSLDEMLGQIVGLTAQISSCDACLIYLLEPETGELVLRASQLPHARNIGCFRIKMGEGITGWVAENRTVVAHSSGAVLDPRFKAVPTLIEDTYEAFLCVPLLHKGETIGVVNVHHLDRHVHSSEETSAISLICELMSSTIATRLLEERHTRVAEHDRQQAERTHAFLASIVESSDDSIIGTDLDGQILSWNRASEKLFGYTASEATGKHISLLFPPDRQSEPVETLERIAHEERIRRFEAVRVGKDGKPIDISGIVAAVRDASGRVQGVYANYRDIADRKRAEREREMLEVQLRHAHKLESIGQLAAGIAHEINTPAQYIGDNARFLKEAFRDLETVFRLYQRLAASADQNDPTREAANHALTPAPDIDHDYLLAEIPRAIDQTLEGIDRVSTLVAAMKEFSHPGKKEKTPTDLNRGIENTITVARNEWKYVAEMETNYDPSLPLIPCLPGDFNQVILNLIVNAAHAIADVVRSGERGKIIVRTRKCPQWVEVEVQDTGGGIPEHARDRIFDPFFTTKEVGRGTGQGLAIARSVVVDKHGGTIHFATEIGKGTTFTIRLPLDGESLPS
jgi:PAS domain S-box-containing protein